MTLPILPVLMGLSSRETSACDYLSDALGSEGPAFTIDRAAHLVCSAVSRHTRTHLSIIELEQIVNRSYSSTRRMQISAAALASAHDASIRDPELALVDKNRGTRYSQASIELCKGIAREVARIAAIEHARITGEIDASAGQNSGEAA